MLKHPEITHCVFDCDGIILDTEGLYFRVFDSYLQTHNSRYTHDFQMKLMGRAPIEATQMLIDNYQIPETVEEVRIAIDKMLAEALPSCEAFPAAKKIIEHFKRCGLPMAMATGSNSFTFGLKEKKHRDLFNHFEHIVLSDDPELCQSKPSPEIYNLAIRRFHSKPKTSSNVIVFEDSVNGAKSALAAGTFVILVPSIPIDLIDRDVIEKCHCVLESLDDFDPVKFGLLPFSQ
ncbi:hypothetical protein ACOME3_002105 [Neoechinorhynchus agilis]